MTSIYFRLVVVSLCLFNEVFGQELTKHSFFGVRTGFVRSTSNLIYSPEAIGTGVNVIGVADRSGFYAGGFYQHHIGKFLAYRVELNYQKKGSNQNDQLGNYIYSLPFNYLGLTPLAGFTPLPGLGLFAGPEANLRVNSIAPSTALSPASVEFGISSRLTYRYKVIGLELSYFKGLSRFYRFNLGGPVTIDFENQNWQAGIFIVIFQPKRNT